MGKVPPRVPGRNAFPAPSSGGGGVEALHLEYFGSTQVIATSTYTSVKWDFQYATSGVAASLTVPAANGTQVTAAAGCLVLVSYGLSWDGGIGDRFSAVLVNGVESSIGDTSPGLAGANNQIHSGSGIVALGSGDTLEVQVWQDSGGNLTINGSGSTPRLSIVVLAASWSEASL